MTEAQLEAEEKLCEETGRREELEKKLSDLEQRMDSLNQQLEWLEQVKNQMEEEKTALESRIKEETKAREKAIAKSEANSLSRYIVNALQERRERKNTGGDEK